MVCICCHFVRVINYWWLVAYLVQVHYFSMTGNKETLWYQQKLMEFVNNCIFSNWLRRKKTKNKGHTIKETVSITIFIQVCKLVQYLSRMFRWDLSTIYPLCQMSENNKMSNSTLQLVKYSQEWIAATSCYLYQMTISYFWS